MARLEPRVVAEQGKSWLRTKSHGGKKLALQGAEELELLRVPGVNYGRNIGSG